MPGDIDMAALLNPDLVSAGVMAPEPATAQQPSPLRPTTLSAAGPLAPNLQTDLVNQIMQMAQAPAPQLNPWAAVGSDVAQTLAQMTGRQIGPSVAQQVQAEREQALKNRLAAVGVLGQVQEREQKRQDGLLSIANTLIQSGTAEGVDAGTRAVMDVARQRGLNVPPVLEDALIRKQVTKEDLTEMANALYAGAAPDVIARRFNLPLELVQSYATMPRERLQEILKIPTDTERQQRHAEMLIKERKMALDEAELELKRLAALRPKEAPRYMLIQNLTEEIQRARAAGDTKTAALLQEQLDNQTRMALTEGGFVIGMGTRTPIVTAPAKPPGEAERKALSESNAIITQGEALLEKWQKDPMLKPGFLARGTERELWWGLRLSDAIGPQATPEQKRFLADASIITGTYRRAYAGLAATNPEMVASMWVVPIDAGALTPEQLQAIVDWTRKNRDAVVQGLIMFNRMPKDAQDFYLSKATAGGIQPTPLDRVVPFRSKKDPKKTGKMKLSPSERLPAQFEGEDIEEIVGAQ